MFTHPFEEDFPAKISLKDQISVSFEEIHVVSDQLKKALVSAGVTDVTWYPTGGSPFVIYPNRSVNLDLRTGYADLGNFCMTCGQVSALGFPAAPIEGKVVWPKERKYRLLPGQGPIDPMGIYRLRPTFISGMQGSFSILVGEVVAEILRENVPQSQIDFEVVEVPE